MSGLLRQRLIAYGIGFTVALLTGESNAAIIYSGPISLTGGQIFFDLQNTVPASTVQNAADDFQLSQATTNDGFGNFLNNCLIFDLGSVSAGISDTVIADGSPGNLVGYVTRFTAGQTIGSGPPYDASPYFNSFGATASPSGPQGNGAGFWFTNTRGFVGLRLNIGGQIYYGWADVQTNNFTNAAPGALTLFGYAYSDTPNTPIIAGAVPEPGSFALLLMGAAAVALLRNSRR